MRFESWSKTEVGLVRESNQDNVGCFPDLGLFVVADGMGGHVDGEIASRMAVEILHDAYAGEDDTDPGTLIQRGLLAWLARLRPSKPQPPSDEEIAAREVTRIAGAVEDANRRIFRRGHEDGSPVTRAMGTTVIAAVLHEWSRRIAWAHVGDSRLYRMRDGSLELLTADHTRFGDPYRRGGPVPLDLPHTNQLTSALGVGAEVAVASGSADVRPGDVYMLSSDGVSGLVPAARIAEVLGSAASAREAGEELVRQAMASGGSDNASVIVVRVLP
jgi:serine/threonine protein phosphatase PrpC